MVAGRVPHHSHGSAFSSLWDKLGIVASGLCLIDCVVLPIVSTALLSFQSGFGWAEKIHWLLLPIIGMTAGMAFYHSWKAHRSYAIVASGVTGFLLLVGGEIFEAKLRIFGINAVSIVGSALLIGAHLRNLIMHLSHRHSCTIDHAGSGQVPGRQLFGRSVVLVENQSAEHAAQVP